MKERFYKIRAVKIPQPKMPLILQLSSVMKFFKLMTVRIFSKARTQPYRI